jgi:hypothetical protein
MFIDALRGARARAILTGVVLALGASFLPAHAATGDPAPSLLATSVDNGWSKSVGAVAATYTTSLGGLRAASNIVVTDRAGNPVNGVVQLNQSVDRAGHIVTDSRTLVFKPDSDLTSALGPYSVAFTAHGANQDAAATDATDARVFRVDNAAPFAPTLDSSGPVSVASGAIQLTGDALEAKPLGIDPANVSGLAYLVVHFYNPVSNAAYLASGDPARLGAEVGSPEIAPITCTGGYCPLRDTFAHALSRQLAPGVWSIRVSTIDLAGNTSGESNAATFLVAPAA